MDTGTKNLKWATIILAIIGQTGTAIAEQADRSNDVADRSQGPALTEVTVQAKLPASQIITLSDTQQLSAPDSAALLRTIPGANLNQNGVISGIAQYRGLFGDRVALSLDSSPALTGGPNAMDTPLSYAPAPLLKDLNVHPGIVPVSVAQESIGGHINARFNRGDYTNDSTLNLRGIANGRYGDNGHQSSVNLQLVAANNQHKVAVLAAHDEGENSEAGNNILIGGTQYQRSRTDLSYGWQLPKMVAEFYIGQLNISNTGTPALAMDIVSVETDLAGFSLSNDLDNGTKLSVNIALGSVEHEMDNHSLRQPPMMAMNYRTNLATADNQSWTIKAQIPVSAGRLTIGTDGNLVGHESIISNPQNRLFELVNFHQVERDTLGLFTELNGALDQHWNIIVGARFNNVSLSAANVSGSGMMGMMAINSNNLAMNFNQADRDISHNNVDLVINLSRSINSRLSMNIDLGIKNRAPSYQELYLWLPLPITAGLADGRSYLGNLALKSETAREINIGLNYKGERFSIAPQVFYRRIDDYIQGTLADSSLANTISTMMSGAPALMHNNVDAKMFGFDTNWHLSINHSWSMDGILSYVRAKRTDISDNLYRIPPANGHINLRYRPKSLDQTLQLSIESQVYARQTKVARFNNQSESAGYGIIDLAARWSVSESLQVQARLNNLFDRIAINHLSGRNRVNGSEINLGEGLPELGRNFNLAVRLNW